MKLSQHIFKALIAGAALLAFPVSATEPSVPDFSKGMPGVKLEKNEKAHGNETFELKTALSSKEFSTTLIKFLGPGWGGRKLNPEEMILAANKGRTSNAIVNLAVYQPPFSPMYSAQIRSSRTFLQKQIPSSKIIQSLEKTTDKIELRSIR